MSPAEAILWLVAGFVIGGYAGAIGAGGGFLVTPLLLLRFHDAHPAEVTAASLVVVAVTSMTAVLLARREARMDCRLVLVMMALVVPAGLAGAAATSLVPRTPFALGFGALLFALAIYVALRPVPKVAAPVTRSWRRELLDRDGNRYVYHVPIARSLAPNIGVGFLSSLAGIGGGPIGVPMMTYIMRVPHAIAMPSMHLLMVFQASAAVALHIAAGHTGAPLVVVPWLALGVTAAAPVARVLRRRVGQGRLMQALAAGLLIVAIRTMVEGLG